MLKDDATPVEQIIHKGNDMVDKAAAALREELEEEAGGVVLKDASDDCLKAKAILKALGTVLAKWPALPRGMERQHDEAKYSLRIAHEWTFAPEHKYWRCKACGIFNRNAFEDGPPRHAGPCRPGRGEERLAKAEELGHCLATTERSGVTVVYCQHCAAHGSWRWQKLLETCKETPPNAQSRAWLKKVERGAEVPLQLSARQARLAGKIKTDVKHRAKRRVQKATEPASVVVANPLKNKRTAELATKKRWEAKLRRNEPTATKSRSASAKAPSHEPADAHRLDARDGCEGTPEEGVCVAAEVHEQVPQDPPEGQGAAGDRHPDAQDAMENQTILEEMDCPKCLSNILDSDLACSYCGWARTTTRLRDAVPGPTAQPATPKLIPCQAKAPQSEATSLLSHGGTFAPPPRCLAENPTRSAMSKFPTSTSTARSSFHQGGHSSTDLTIGQVAMIEMNRENAIKKRRLTRSSTRPPRNTLDDSDEEFDAEDQDLQHHVLSQNGPLSKYDAAAIVPVLPRKRA